MTEVRKFNIISIEETSITPAEDAAIKDLLCECFPNDVEAFSKTRYWHTSGPEYSVVYMEDDKALGHVGIVVREVICDGNKVKIAGVQNVAVSTQMRGSGLSKALMTRAMEIAAEKQIKFGMLFCSDKLKNFYESQGWVVKNAQIQIVDNGAAIPDTNQHLYMIKQLSNEPFQDCNVINLNGMDW